MDRRVVAAVVLATCLSAVPAFGAQQFGRDSVYAEAGKASTPVARQVDRNGRDSVYATPSVVVRPQPRSMKVAALKPGRE